MTTVDPSSPTRVRLRHVTLATVTIETDAPFTIAAPQVAVAADRPAAADADGNAVVPGSSIAGSLRSHFRDHGLDELLLGGRSPLEKGDGTPLTSSLLRIVGTEVRRSDRVVSAEDLSPRTTNSIDRRRAAAKTLHLSTSTSVPAETRVRVFLRIDRHPDELFDPVDGALLDLGRLLWTWPPWLGGGRTRGEGRAHVTAVAVGTLDLTQRDDLTSWLGLHGPDLHDAVTRPVDAPADLAPPEPVLVCRLDLVDPLHVAGGSDGNHSEAYKYQGRFVVEGSSLKGVFRSRAEYIVRSLGRPACGVEETVGSCGTCPCCALFGWVGGRGLVSFDRSVVERHVESRREHVAIDRFSGGSGDRKLFSEQVVESGRLLLQVRALGPLPPWAAVLLLYILRDLDDGLVGLGGRTARGFGTVRVADEDRPLLADLPSLAPHLPQPAATA